MASTTVNVHVAPRDLGPGAPAFGALLVQGLRAVGRSFAQAAERQGSRRAAQELRRLAWTFDAAQPEVAGELRAAARHCESLAEAGR